MKKTVINIGLRNIRIAQSRICLIDGLSGKLFYRGYDIQDLAARGTYEEIVFLLLYNALPRSDQLKRFSRLLASERAVPQGIINVLRELPRSTPTMNMLQSAIALLTGYDSGISDESKGANMRKVIGLIAKLPTIVASWDRIRRNLDPKQPNNHLSHPANFLYMLQGAVPDDMTSRNFDVCLILHAEHAFNASTFAARVVASTRANAYSAMSAAVGSLSGELHGGANAQVMKNLFSIGEPSKVEDWVKSRLDNGKRIMGMGHAVYKTMDPRALVLKRMARILAQKTGESKWYTMTRKIEQAAEKEFRKRKGTSIFPNVDLYSASVYYMLGIPPELFTSVFAIARAAGWSAHILEEKFPEPPVKPLLYRPSSEYRGKYCGEVGCKYIPLHKRI